MSTGVAGNSRAALRALVAESPLRAKLARKAVSKAILLAGGDSTSLEALTSVQPKPLLPVLNRPLIDWQVRALARSGIRDVGVALSPENVDPVSKYLETRAGSTPRFHYAVDELPRGPAGSLKLFEELLGPETFLVVDGNTFLGDVDLEALIRAHLARRAKATFGVLPPPMSASSPEAVVSADGRIQGIFQLHQSNERRRSRRLAGVSVFDSAVLDLVPRDGFFDVKDRLFSELQARGALVAAESTRGLCVPIDTLLRYLQLHAEALESDLPAPPNARQLADGLWVGEGTEIPSSSYVVGPIFVGDDCRIEDGAQLIGPAVIGDRARIGRGSFVRGSVLWEGVELAPGSKVEQSIVASGASLSRDTWLTRSVLVPGSSNPDDTPVRLEEQAFPPSIPAPNGLSRRGAATKAVMDFVGAGALLLLLAPVFPLCAIAIWLESGGPVFFRQLRGGKHGIPFRMLKFRTMVKDADRRLAELRSRNETDGPVFKIFDDPRITMVGRFLRRTSLDELPQLWNVLRGEMSLVGPRPLAMDQLRYCPAWRDRRLSVKPGITGLWQVNGRSKSKFHDWVRYDIEYTKRQSLALDLKILAKTAIAVIRGSGAC